MLEGHRPLHHDHHLRVLNRMRHIRYHPRRLLGLMHSDRLAGRQRTAQHIAALSAVRHLSHRHLVQRIHPRLRKYPSAGRRHRRLRLHHPTRRHHSRQPNTHLPPRYLFHPAIVTRSRSYQETHKEPVTAKLDRQASIRLQLPFNADDPLLDERDRLAPCLECLGRVSRIKVAGMRLFGGRTPHSFFESSLEINKPVLQICMAHNPKATILRMTDVASHHHHSPRTSTWVIACSRSLERERYV